jgi:hypothetical protein
LAARSTSARTPCGGRRTTRRRRTSEHELHAVRRGAEAPHQGGRREGRGAAQEVLSDDAAIELLNAEGFGISAHGRELRTVVVKGNYEKRDFLWKIICDMFDGGRGFSHQVVTRDSTLGEKLKKIACPLTREAFDSAMNALVLSDCDSADGLSVMPADAAVHIASYDDESSRMDAAVCLVAYAQAFLGVEDMVEVSAAFFGDRPVLNEPGGWGGVMFRGALMGESEKNSVYRHKDKKWLIENLYELHKVTHFGELGARAPLAHVDNAEVALQKADDEDHIDQFRLYTWRGGNSAGARKSDLGMPVEDVLGNIGLTYLPAKPPKGVFDESDIAGSWAHALSHGPIAALYDAFFRGGAHLPSGEFAVGTTTGSHRILLFTSIPENDPSEFWEVFRDYRRRD